MTSCCQPIIEKKKRERDIVDFSGGETIVRLKMLRHFLVLHVNAAPLMCSFQTQFDSKIITLIISHFFLHCQVIQAM